MDNDEFVIRRSVVNKILQVAEACVDENKKGRRVQMPEFWSAMDDLGFSGKQVR